MKSVTKILILFNILKYNILANKEEVSDRLKKLPHITTAYVRSILTHYKFHTSSNQNSAQS